MDQRGQSRTISRIEAIVRVGHTTSLTCPGCDRTFRMSPRARYCSDRCRKRGSRAGRATDIDRASRLLADASAELRARGTDAVPGLLRRLRETLEPLVPRSAVKPRTTKLPWPRAAEDGTPLGVDVRARIGEIRRLIIAGRFSVPGLDVQDICGEVALVILRRNTMPSAFDPRRSSFGHYVHLVAQRTCSNLACSSSAAREALGEAGDAAGQIEEMGADDF